MAIARLLSPEEFGTFAVVTFAVVLLTLVGDTGLGGTLIQQAHPPTDRELATTLTVQVVLWTAVLVAILFLGTVLPILLPDLPPSAPVLAYLLGVSAWLTAMRALPSAMLTRTLRFGPQAVLEVVQQVVYFGVAVALAALGYGVVSFGVAAVAQGLIATVVLWRVFGRWPGFAMDGAIVRRMWGFGIGYQIALVLRWARDSVVPVFGGLAGGLSAIGLIQFGWRNGQFAVSVEEIVARVAFPTFSRLEADPRRLASVATLAIEISFLATAVIQGWLAATAPTLVPLVFSERWVPAIGLFQMICVASLASGPVLILRAIVYAGGDHRRGLALAGFDLVSLFVLFPVSVVVFGLPGAGVAFAIAGIAGLLVYVHATRAAIRFPWRSLARMSMETIVASGVALLALSQVTGADGLVLSGILYVATFGLMIGLFELGLVRRLRSYRSTIDSRV